MSYAIREVVEHSRVLERQGHSVIKLNIGDPVMFDFKTPDHINQAFIDAIREGRSGYSDSEGIPELRQAVSNKEARDGVDVPPEDVIATTGVTEGLEMVLASALDESSEILVPGPAYPAYVEYAKLFGSRPIAYRKIEDQGWRPDCDDIRHKITSRTKAIIICSPNNPTGAVYRRSDLAEMTDIAGEHGIMVISDEIYDKITFDGKAVSPASVNKDIPSVILNGLSKVYLSTGWRIGYIAFRDPDGSLREIREGVLKQARARLCANTVAQCGLAAALDGPDDHIRVMCRKLRPRRDLAAKRLGEMPGLSLSMPEGSFYMFPRIGARLGMGDKQFVLSVLENCHVLLVHGSGFHEEYGKDHFRLVFLPPEHILDEALSRMERYLRTIEPRGCA